MDTGAPTAIPRVFDGRAPVTTKLLLSYGNFAILATCEHRKVASTCLLWSGSPAPLVLCEPTTIPCTSTLLSVCVLSDCPSTSL